MPWKSTSPASLQRVHDQIALADRAAAREHDDVLAGGRRDRGGERGEAVGRRWRARPATPPCAPMIADSVNSVDVVDLRRARAAARARRSRRRSRGSRRAVSRRRRRPGPSRRRAGAPIRLGLSRSPLRGPSGRRAMSAARRPTCCRGYTGVNTRTSAPSPFSVSSTITTASAPVGHRRAGGDLDALAARHARGSGPARCRPSRCSAADFRMRAAPRRTCPRRRPRTRPSRRGRTAARRRRASRGFREDPVVASRIGTRSMRSTGTPPPSGAPAPRRAGSFPDGPHRVHSQS